MKYLLESHTLQWETPLMAAAKQGHLQALHTLLELGAEADFVPKGRATNGVTALILAAKAGRIEVVKVSKTLDPLEP